MNNRQTIENAVNSIIEFKDHGKLLDVANAASADDIRTVIDKKMAFGGVDFTDHTADQTVLSDNDAIAIKTAAIAKLNQLVKDAILAAIAKVNDYKLLDQVISAADNDAIRTVLNKNAVLGTIDLDFAANPQSETLLSNADATAIQVAAQQKQKQLIKDAIVAAIDVIDDPKDLAKITQADTLGVFDLNNGAEEVRKALNKNLKLCNIDFTSNEANETLLSNADATIILALAIQKQNQLIIKNAIKHITDPKDLDKIVNAPNNETIRKELDKQPKFGDIQFTAFGNDKTEKLLTNADAEALQALAKQRQTQLNNNKKINDAIKLITNPSQLDKIVIAGDSNTIRQALDKDTNLGNIDFTGNEANETLLSNADAQALKALAIQKRNQLIINEAIKVITDPTQLDKIVQAANNDEIRQALDKDKKLGEIDFGTNSNFKNETLLTNADAEALKALAIQKRNQLIIKKAIEGITDPKHLDKIVNPGLDTNGFRAALHKDNNLGNIDFTTNDNDKNPTLLSDADAKDLRQLAVQKHFDLTNQAEYVRITTDAKLDNYPALKAKLTDAGNKNNVIQKIGDARSRGEKIDDLLDKLKAATNKDYAESAAKALGLKADREDIRLIMQDNRDQAIANIGSKDYRTREARKQFDIIDINIFGKETSKYRQFIVAAKQKIQTAQASLKPNLDDLDKIDDTLNKMKTDLLVYRKYLEEGLADSKLDAPRLDAKLHGNPDDKDAYKDELVKNFPVEKHEQIKERIAKIDSILGDATSLIDTLKTILAGNAAPAQRLAYATPDQAKEMTHTYEGNNYDDAVAAKDLIVGVAAQQVRSGGINVNPQPATTDVNNTIVTIPITASSMNNSKTIKTATIRTHSIADKSAKAEFFFSAEDAKKIKAEDSIKEHWYSKEKIPGFLALDWAQKNITTILSVMPDKNEPINITQGDMPNVCVTALQLYCDFKGLKCNPPRGFTIDDKQKELFKKTWATLHPNDVGIGQLKKLESDIRSPRPF